MGDMEERLQKIISRAGIASRRAAEKLILEGRVAVDGEVVRELGRKCDPGRQRISLDGIPIGEEEKRVYYLLNKPKGFVSTAKDERGRRTVLDLIPGAGARVYPVGRLDANTEGLLLITNDGILMNGLLHPRYKVEKTYVAKVTGNLREEGMLRLRQGVLLEDGITAPAKVDLLESGSGFFRIKLTIHEGRNRQVRRMFAAVGCDVKALKRTGFAGLGLDGVRRGEYRELSREEVRMLYEIAGMGKEG